MRLLDYKIIVIVIVVVSDEELFVRIGSFTKNCSKIIKNGWKAYLYARIYYYPSVGNTNSIFVMWMIYRDIGRNRCLITYQVIVGYFLTNLLLLVLGWFLTSWLIEICCYHLNSKIVCEYKQISPHVLSNSRILHHQSPSTSFFGCFLTSWLFW